LSSGLPERVILKHLIIRGVKYMEQKKNKLIAEVKNHTKKYGFPVKKKDDSQQGKKGKN